MDTKVILNICLVVVLVIILLILMHFNHLIKLQNKVKKAKANIAIYLNKRFDLIPNLVECVKNYTKYEGSTLEAIVQLRNQPHLSINETNQADYALTRYLITLENYPNLKTDNQYLNLQQQLTNLETELEKARHQYNDDVTRYNVAVESVPGNLVAAMFAFKKAELFQV